MLILALLASTASALAFAVSARAPVAAVGIVIVSVCFILQVVRIYVHACVCVLCSYTQIRISLHVLYAEM